MKCTSRIFAIDSWPLPVAPAAMCSAKKTRQGPKALDAERQGRCSSRYVPCGPGMLLNNRSLLGVVRRILNYDSCYLTSSITWIMQQCTKRKPAPQLSLENLGFTRIWRSFDSLVLAQCKIVSPRAQLVPHEQSQQASCHQPHGSCQMPRKKAWICSLKPTQCIHGHAR